jgi:pimeloyl-ACP methyl ester carboxylesterase
MSDIEASRFTVNVSDEDLEELRRRLRQTRWATDLNNEDGHFGIQTAYLKDLAGYWLEEFDWRAAEKRINEFAQYRMDVSGQPVHFIREPGKGPAPIPIILSHGWPWSFWDWSKVIRPLADPASYGGDPADAFDVILPSLPGFDFSTPLNDAQMNFWKIAELWHELMTQKLGYSKYAAGGADYGALVSGQLGHKYADELYGIHLGHDIPLFIFQGERPWDLTGGELVPADASDELRRDIIKFQYTYAAHVAIHILEPQTEAHGLADSPVGMLAYLLQRWSKWSDQDQDFDKVFPRDHVLTNATMWWVNQAFSTSVRLYSNSNRYPWQPSHDRQPVVQAPTGFTFLAGDVYPPGVHSAADRIMAFNEGPMRDYYNVTHVSAGETGGHFIAWENPEATIKGIRDTFRPLR